MTELLRQKANESALNGLHYQAEKYLRQLIALHPSAPEHWLALASSHFSRGCFKDAIDDLIRFQKLGGVSQHTNFLFAKCHNALGDFLKANEFYRRALSDDASSKVQWEVGLQNLLFGRHGEGWSQYQARLKVHSLDYLHIYPFQFAPWSGFELNQTILIHGEQGLGDELMFSQFFNELIEKAKEFNAKLYVATNSVLFELLQESYPEIEFLLHDRGDLDVQNWGLGYVPDWFAQLPKHTQHAPIGSLPYLLKTEGVANKKGISPNAWQVQYFEGLLHQKIQASGWANPNGLKVGVAWCANNRTTFGLAKSIPLQTFENLSRIDGITLIGLQNAEYGSQAQDFPNVRMIDLHSELHGFNKTAGLIANLDLVISIDTSYAHLAAAMNKPTWVLLKKNHDWRFGLKDQESYFYSQMDLFRQESLGDWSVPLQAIESKARQLIKELALL